MSGTPERKAMWLPKTVYERVPQYWLLLGLLFMSSGMYLGFDYRLAYFYFGIGLICALWSMWTFSVRLRRRTTSHDVESALTQSPLENE